MRQAGRYLPEYRKIREKAGSFLDLVYNPDLSSEITLQPLRRFGMDAAILFSDILVVPHALGQSVTFEAGEGPKLSPIRSESDFFMLNLEDSQKKFNPVFETVDRVKEKMRIEGFHDAALIGFCGSPWTVLCYMVEGGASRDFNFVRRLALQNPDFFQKLNDIVVEASCAYLSGQIKAGAEIIQLFDSWSGVLDEGEFERWVIEPTKAIRAYLKKNHPAIPVIGFPRGAGAMAIRYAQETGVDCLGLDQTVPLDWAAKNLQTLLPVQGNLDPLRLLSGGVPLERAMQKIHDAFCGRPFIFNLGHGVIKETGIANVETLTAIVRNWKS